MESQPEKPQPPILSEIKRTRSIQERIGIPLCWLLAAGYFINLFCGLNLLTMSVSEQGPYSYQYLLNYKTDPESEFFDAKVVYSLWSPNEGRAFVANTTDGEPPYRWVFPHWHFAGEATKKDGV